MMDTFFSSQIDISDSNNQYANQVRKDTENSFAAWKFSDCWKSSDHTQLNCVNLYETKYSF